MQLEIFNSLVKNISLLLSLWVIRVLLTDRATRLKPAMEKTLTGLSVGLIVLGVMLDPLVFMPGVIFDTRSILLSISGVFFGAVPTVIAAVIASAYRLMAGGAGALPGVGTIITSSVIGLGARIVCQRRGRDIKAYGLYLMGLAVHIVMLAQLLLTLPDEIARDVLYHISLPVITLYPLGTVLVGLLFSLQQTRSTQARKLEESEARYRLLFETTPDALFVLDSAGRIVDFNSVTIERYGYTPAELTQMTVYDLAAFDLNDQVIAKSQKALENGATFEWWHRRKDGSLVPVEINAKLIVLDGHTDVLASVRDLSYRISAEKALRESEERLRLAVRSGNVGLWDHDLTTNQVHYSAEWKHQLGYADDEIGDGNDEWQKRLHPEDRERALTVTDAYLKAPWPDFENEFRLQHKDGSYRWILSHADLIHNDEGMPIRMVGTQIDITEIKKTYQELQESHKRMQSLAQEVISAQERERHSIARELHDESGQMLTAIIIQLDMLDERLPEDLASLKADLNMIGDSLRDLMENLRQLSHGLRPPALDTLGFEAALENLCTDFCGRVNLELDYQVVPIPNMEDVKAITLYRFAQEALTNIAKYAQASKVVVSLSYEDSIVCLSIRDDGVGFEADLQKMKGMGLAGMAERLELVQGGLEIDSQQGRGTLVTASVPVGGK